MADLGRLLKTLGIFLAVVAAIAGFGVVLAVPLWYFSTNFKKGYTIFVLALVGFVLLFLLARRLTLAGRAAGGFYLFVEKSLLPILKKAALVLITLAVVYGIVFFVSRGWLIVAVITILAWLLLLGFLKYGRKGKT
jgi:hypothetical protein